MLLKVNPALQQHFRPARLPEATAAATKPVQTAAQTATQEAAKKPKSVLGAIGKWIWDHTPEIDNNQV